MLRVNEQLGGELLAVVTGEPLVTYPVTTQDITPYGNGAHHINSILQPSTATAAPVIGLAITSAAAVPGCGTGASHESDIASAARYAVEVAKGYGDGRLDFHDAVEFENLVSRYGSLTHLQTFGRTPPGVLMAATPPQSGAVASAPKSIGSDDYSLSRVPRDQRFGFWSMLLQWLAQSGSISQFTLGATIGVGMTFGDAFLAFTLGAVILEVVIFAIGLAGMREGLATPMLTRWVGFGRNGSALVSFVIAVSLVGWFGVQNKIFGDSVSALVGGPAWMWCVLAGIAITALVIFGFKYMANFAKIVTPLFFAMVAFSVIRTLNDHSFGDLVHSPPPGDTIPLAVAATAIAGGYMTGAIVSPEMTRYNRKARTSSCRAPRR